MVVTSFQCFHPNRVFSDILPFDTLGFVVGLSYSSSIPFNIDLGCESMGDASPIIMVVLCVLNCDGELLRHKCTISSSSICMSMEAIKSYTNSWSWWCSCWSTRPFVVIILLNYFGSWSLLVVVFYQAPYIDFCTHLDARQHITWPTPFIALVWPSLLGFSMFTKYLSMLSLIFFSDKELSFCT